ncbi:MAG: hypothetical protein BWY59_02333 [Verrucomicrobia bacterium ADurb.Bin345]|nr:MAG: hypothetical protein BWY59_02333 [Verrucomicrobia bacterium ADurb.Bin345]
MPDVNPLFGLLHCQHALDPQQEDVQFMSASESHYELMEIARQLERIHVVLQAMFDASQQLQNEAQAYLQNQAVHAESFLGRLDTPDYYPFVALPHGTLVKDCPDGGRQFVLPDGAVIVVKNDRTMVAAHDGVAVELTPQAGHVVLPNGQRFEVSGEFCRTTHTAAGIEGLPDSVEPVCIGPGRYRAEFPDGVTLTVWHALPGQDCMLSVANPTGGTLVISRKGIQGIGLEVQVRLLPDGALGFRVQPEADSSAVQYLHSGVARPDEGVVQLALSNGTTLTYSCGDTGGGEDNPDDDGLPHTFTCEERGQCSV